MAIAADVVLLTVNEHETEAVRRAFDSRLAILGEGIEGRIYWDYGTVQGLRVLHTQTEMGDHGAADGAKHAIDHLDPRLLLSVGIAWGAKEDEHEIGDILLSREIHDWAHRKESEEEGTTARGLTPPARDELINFFRTCHTDWRPLFSKPPIRPGLILSNPVLYDSRPERQKALAAKPGALGGEMEGRGIVHEAVRARKDWLVVKAICDWGCDKNASGIDKETHQKMAARHAAGIVYHAIQTGLLPVRQRISGSKCNNSVQETPWGGGEPRLRNFAEIDKKIQNLLNTDLCQFEAKVVDREQHGYLWNLQNVEGDKLPPFFARTVQPAWRETLESWPGGAPIPRANAKPLVHFWNLTLQRLLGEHDPQGEAPIRVYADCEDWVCAILTAFEAKVDLHIEVSKERDATSVSRGIAKHHAVRLVPEKIRGSASWKCLDIALNLIRLDVCPYEKEPPPITESSTPEQIRIDWSNVNGVIAQSNYLPATLDARGVIGDYGFRFVSIPGAHSQEELMATCRAIKQALPALRFFVCVNESLDALLRLPQRQVLTIVTQALSLLSLKLEETMPQTNPIAAPEPSVATSQPVSSGGISLNNCTIHADLLSLGNQNQNSHGGSADNGVPEILMLLEDIRKLATQAGRLQAVEESLVEIREEFRKGPAEGNIGKVKRALDTLSNIESLATKAKLLWDLARPFFGL